MIEESKVQVFDFFDKRTSGNQLILTPKEENIHKLEESHFIEEIDTFLSNDSSKKELIIMLRDCKNPEDTILKTIEKVDFNKIKNKEKLKVKQIKFIIQGDILLKQDYLFNTENIKIKSIDNGSSVAISIELPSISDVFQFAPPYKISAYELLKRLKNNQTEIEGENRAIQEKYNDSFKISRSDKKISADAINITELDIIGIIDDFLCTNNIELTIKFHKKQYIEILKKVNFNNIKDQQKLNGRNICFSTPIGIDIKLNKANLLNMKEIIIKQRCQITLTGFMNSNASSGEFAFNEAFEQIIEKPQKKELEEDLKQESSSIGDELESSEALPQIKEPQKDEPKKDPKSQSSLINFIKKNKITSILVMIFIISIIIILTIIHLTKDTNEFDNQIPI